MGGGALVLVLAGAVLPGLLMASVLDVVLFGGGFNSGNASRWLPLLAVLFVGVNFAFAVWLEKRIGFIQPKGEGKADVGFGIMFAIGAISGIAMLIWENTYDYRG